MVKSGQKPSEDRLAAVSLPIPSFLANLVQGQAESIEMIRGWRTGGEE